MTALEFLKLVNEHYEVVETLVSTLSRLGCTAVDFQVVPNSDKDTFRQSVANAKKRLQAFMIGKWAPDSTPEGRAQDIEAILNMTIVELREMRPAVFGHFEKSMRKPGPKIVLSTRERSTP
jgi:hypothetical protein